jgi:hypothetical protein
MPMDTEKERGMGKKKESDFTSGYKKLPVKKRVDLIKVARNLLKQQQENNAILADAPVPQKVKRSSAKAEK